MKDEKIIDRVGIINYKSLVVSGAGTAVPGGASDSYFTRP